MLTLLVLFIALGLAGSGLMFVGVRGLLTRRVTIYSGKWLLALIALCCLPQFLNGLKLLGAANSLALINLILYPGILLIFWLVTKGHILFGVSEETAKEALTGALGKLGVKHEQMLGSIKLEDGGIFQVSIQDWIGTMQLKPKNPAARLRAAQLVAALSEHFSASTAPVRFLPYWIYTFCGGLMLASLLFLTALVVNHLGHRKAPQEQAKPIVTACAQHHSAASAEATVT
jgi:hypothetical protein